jgi:hypothetical protein
MASAASTPPLPPDWIALAQLEAGLEVIRSAPGSQGSLRLIVRRPTKDVREVLEEAHLDLAEGLLGDSWKSRGSSQTPDGSAHFDMQLTLMNVRVITLLSPDQNRWALAGDQLFVDFDLSEENAPAGTRLGLGSAVIEVTALPHTGCQKFRARFGPDALKFVNSPEGKRLRLRGLNAKIVQPGIIRVGDIVKKL